MSIMTGLSGNEMYCLHLKGLSPGELVIGNSVYSLGFVGGIGAGLKTPSAAKSRRSPRSSMKVANSRTPAWWKRPSNAAARASRA